MRALSLALVMVVALGTRADAGTVSIVVTGDTVLKETLTTQLESWLRAHGYTIGPDLASDVKSSLLNCMVIDDEGCARGVVDARAKTDSVIFTEARAPRTKASNATTLIVYWLVKGKEPVGMRRACPDCNADLLQSTLDDMLKAVLGASDLTRGRLALTSQPAGLTVMLDNESVGITPLERDLPVGKHTVVLMSRGRKVGERSLHIEADATAEITMKVTIPKDDHGPSRVLPGTMMAVGGAAVVAGAILFFTSDTDDGTKPEYYDTKPPGIGIAAGGVAVALVGTYLWYRAGARDSAPAVAIDHHGGFIGWARAF